MGEDIRGLEAAVDAIARDQAAGVERRAAMQRSSGTRLYEAAVTPRDWIALTLRRAGRLYHLKIAAADARRRVLAIVDEREVTVVALDTGEVLSTHLIEPERRYWRNQRRDPGRGPGSQTTS